MQLRTTSTQRTYRYVRLSIVGVVLLLAVSITAQVAWGGPLGSVSAAYYTPARNVFVGSLCAVALAMLALSGRSVEQALLDVAALLAPVVAFVPTPISAGDISGVAVACPGEGSCIPDEIVPEVANGMVSLAAIGVIGVLGAVVLAVIQRTLGVALAWSLAVAGLLVVGMVGWWTLSPETFLLGAHYVATIGFFVLIAAVAALAAVRPAARTRRRHRILRTAYALIAGGIVLSLVFVVGIVVLQAAGTDLVSADGPPLFFLGEAVALLLFAAFWAVQTAELWNETDPAFRAAGFVRRVRE